MNTENHYQETDLGNISLNPRGEYNPEESYEYLDLVVLEGGSYVCLAENGATITGISPESGKTTQYWQVITIPGSLTPEYIAMHDRVVNLSEQVGADAVEVRTAEQNVSGMELNVTQMQEQTRQSAEAAEQSKDSSAGYAASADASRQAAEESKQNIDVQVTGFDSHVAEKTEEAENDIEAARIAANKAIIAQQEQSVNEVARAGIEAISTAQSAAQTATEKAQAADTSEKNAAASETAAKLSEANATNMAEQVAADKEQVAYDRTAVENAKQEMTGSVAQIEQNTQGISELKEDFVNETNRIDKDVYFDYLFTSSEIPRNVGDIDSAEVGSEISFGSTSWYEYFKIPVFEYQKIEYTIRVTRAKYHVVFVDANGIVISAKHLGNGTSQKVEGIDIAPKGSSFVYIATHASTEINNSEYSVVKLKKPSIEEKDNIVDVDFKIQNKSKYVKTSMLEKGYYSSDTTKMDASTRIRVSKPIELERGDTVYIHNGYKLACVVVLSNGEMKGTEYISIFKAYDNCKAYLMFRNEDGTKNISASELSGKIEITNCKDNVEKTKHEYLLKKYIDGDDTLRDHNYRCVNHRMIKAKKGDRVRCFNNSLAFAVYEYDDNEKRITSSVDYYTGKYNSPGSIYPVYVAPGDHPCGDYVVQNDCWIRCQFSAIAGDSDFNFDSYDEIFGIIHVDNNDSSRMANATKYRFPKSCKKPRVIDRNSFYQMQDGTFVKGKLWISLDDYSENNRIQIIDDNGNIEKTITHNLGHAGSIDYNANNDTLLIIGDGCLYFLNNPSDKASISASDCTTLTISNDISLSSCCWGEDENTVYIACGSTTMKIWKIRTDDAFSSYTIKNIYEFYVRDGVDTHFLRNNVNYTQGCEYDGYLYIGFGTNGHNFLVVELDDNINKATVVGNYMYHLYDSNGAEKNIEPQLVALHEGKIVLGSRDWSSQTSFLAEFTRVY